jgi:glycine cleavage system H protein
MTTRYTKTHEWIRLDGDTAVVGITEHAQSQLGDVVHVELPAIGKTFAMDDEVGAVDSVKAASEVYAPASGEVVAVNDALADTPATVNEDAEGKGWFLKLKLKDPGELEQLMTAEQYKDYVATLS